MKTIELHNKAKGYNWDDGVKNLYSIIKSGNCDKGTALMLFWRCNPRYYLQFSHRKEVRLGEELDVYDFFTELQERYISGQYDKLQTISFDPKNDGGHNWTNDYSNIKPKRKIPDIMYIPVGSHKENSTDHEKAPQQKEESNSSGKKVALTGKFGEHSHIQVKLLLESFGYQYTEGVTEDTDILFAGINPGPELKAAQELGIQICSESYFKALVSMNDLINEFGFNEALNKAIDNEYYASYGLVKMFIEQGADVNYIDSSQFSPLLHAVTKNYDDIEKIVEILLLNGAEVNFIDSYGSHLLFSACVGTPEVFELLLEHGGNIDVIDPENEDSLLIYACNDHDSGRDDRMVKMAESLIKRGADIHYKNNLGETALEKACEIENNHEAVQFLLEHGAEVNIKNDDGDSPLISACSEYQTNRTVQLLIDYGADIHELYQDGETVLEIACNNNNAPLALLLLENGADPNTRTQDGETVLELACEENWIDVVRVLLEKGADPNITTDDGTLLLKKYMRKKNIKEVLQEYGAQ